MSPAFGVGTTPDEKRKSIHMGYEQVAGCALFISFNTLKFMYPSFAGLRQRFLAM
jgi:hypothetical protein